MDREGVQLVVVVTVAAILLVPAAIRRSKGDRWPTGDLGRALDGAILAALVLIGAWLLRTLMRD